MKWVGGKSLSCNKIASLIPQHECYVEVFAGGLWVYFCKKPSKTEIINDINSELINFYRVLQRQCDEFKAREKYELYSRELYYEYLKDFNTGKHSTLDNVEKAFRFFCLIKEAFGGNFGSGWGYGSTRNVAMSMFNEFKTIDEVTVRFKNCQIDNRDFEDIIKGYDNINTFFFADPPYMNADNKTYYFKSTNSSFGINDHQRLFLALKDIKGKCLLTVDDTTWIRERYTKENGFYTMENKVNYSSAPAESRQIVTELIITNYDTTLITKHLDTKQGRLEF